MGTFSALLAICAGNSPVTGEFPAQRPVTRTFDVFFDLHLDRRLSKQWWGWWFETLSRPLWRHCNGYRRVSQSAEAARYSLELFPSQWNLTEFTTALLPRCLSNFLVINRMTLTCDDVEALDFCETLWSDSGNHTVKTGVSRPPLLAPSEQNFIKIQYIC